MASARKKQDEKNLKSLRELAALPENRYCFDCNQRGPTYVNITIGSFVCTKCSGLLRGLTPPHRVKSISMATFTPEEVESMRTRGNYYCRRTWMSLYDGIIPTDGIQDEQKIRDFMVDKYEKKRFYVEPDASILKNGHNTNNNSNNNGTSNNGNNQRSRPQTNDSKQDFSNVTNGKTLSINGIGRPENKRSDMKNPRALTNGRGDFVADFAHADIFNAANNNGSAVTKKPSPNVTSFVANFDDNPVFSSATTMTSNAQQFNINQSTSLMANLSQSAIVQPPPEDKYAALKDLDNALKAQPIIDWNPSSNGTSNGSNYSTSSSANGTTFNSPMSQGSSLYGSPSQGQFPTLFQSQQSPPIVSNPFNVQSAYWNNDDTTNNAVINGCASTAANPFRATNQQDNFKSNGNDNNGFHANFQAADFNQMNGTAAVLNMNAWTPNPFKIGTASNGNSYNPFL